MVVHTYNYIYIYIIAFDPCRFMVDTVAESFVWLDPPGVMARSG